MANELSALKLDPWVASSLLQKAIRRGETGEARRAARALFRFRGQGAFRRLITIAIEDVGIANVPLACEVVHLGLDKSLRSVLGADEAHLDHLVAKLASTPKERSADYLYCAATKLPAAQAERELLCKLTTVEQLRIAADLNEPLIKRATGALLACSRDEQITDYSAVERFISMTSCPDPMGASLLALSKKRAHAFALMLPILYSRWEHFGRQNQIVTEDIPATVTFRELPLYALDKHTHVGKRAIQALAKNASDVRASLAKWAMQNRHTDVAAMAAFYADAAPIRLAFQWPTGSLLEKLGTYADMTDAGCHFDGVEVVLASVKSSLARLNQLRRALLR